MKKIRQLVISFLSLFTIFSLISFPVSAEVIFSEEADVNVPSSQTIDDDLFLAGRSATIEGTINGDLYAAGGLVTINGTINGDVWVLGGTVTISGFVQDDVRGGGGTVNFLNATVGDNVTVFGGSVSFDQQTTVGGTIIFTSGSLDFDARGQRHLIGLGENVSLNGAIEKNVRLGTQVLTLGEKAQIGGDLTYNSEQEAVIADSTSVKGNTKQISEKITDQVDWKTPWLKIQQLSQSSRWGLKIWSFLANLLVGFILIYLFPKPSKNIATTVLENPWSCLGWGLLLLILTVPVSIIIALTGIGIPLAIIVGLIFALEIYLSRIFVSLLFGISLLNLTTNQEPNPYLSLIVGLVVFMLITSIQLVGFFFHLATITFGLGSIFLFKRQLITLQKA